MFKNDLVDAIAKEAGSTKVDAENFLNSFLTVVEKALKKNEDVALIGFGTFKVVKTKARKGRNPQNGKEIKIPEGKKVKFVAGKNLKLKK